MQWKALTKQEKTKKTPICCWALEGPIGPVFGKTEKIYVYVYIYVYGFGVPFDTIQYHPIQHELADQLITENAWVFMGEPIRGPKNPKPQLRHIWADHVIYSIPEYEKSDPNVQNELIIKKNCISEKSNFFGDLSTGKGHQDDYGHFWAKYGDTVFK